MTKTAQYVFYDIGSFSFKFHCYYFIAADRNRKKALYVKLPTTKSTASLKKVGEIYSPESSQKKRKLHERLIDVDGYRIIDMTEMSKALFEAHVCNNGKILRLDLGLNLAYAVYEIWKDIKV